MFLLLMLIIFSPLIGSIIRNRTSLLERTERLIKRTQNVEWKAWKLSATEPIFTTAVAILLLFFNIPFQPIALLNLLFFMILVGRLGSNHRRVRLVLTVMSIRFAILIWALIQWAYTGEVFTAVPLFLLLISQILFCAYQVRVTPELEVRGWERDQSRLPHPVDEPLLSEMTLIEDEALWDEQVALIERLKAEEETAEAHPVGRV